MQISHQEEERRLIPTHQPDLKHPQGQFTTDAMLALERENLALVRGGVNVAEPIADQVDVRQSSTAKGLFADQLHAVAFTLTSKDWATAIEGLAGTTKTTTVGAIREFAEGQGYTVRGFGMTSGSVEALSGAGVDSRTIASLVENPLPTRTTHELWIVDESSLLDSRKANQVLTAAKGQADRIVFVGDQRQHHAIEAGAPVRQLLANQMAVVELTTIRRQRDPDLKQAVHSSSLSELRVWREVWTPEGRFGF